MGANLSKRQLEGMSNKELAEELSRWGQDMGEDLTPFIERLGKYHYLDGEFVSGLTTTEEWMEDIHTVYMTNLDPRLAKIIKHAWQYVMKKKEGRAQEAAAARGPVPETAASQESTSSVGASFGAKINKQVRQHVMKKEEGRTPQPQVATVTHGRQATGTTASQERNDGTGTPIVPDAVESSGAVIATGSSELATVSFQHESASQLSNRVGASIVAVSSSTRLLDQTDDSSVPPHHGRSKRSMSGSAVPPLLRRMRNDGFSSNPATCPPPPHNKRLKTTASPQDLASQLDDALDDALDCSNEDGKSHDDYGYHYDNPDKESSVNLEPSVEEVIATATTTKRATSITRQVPFMQVLKSYKHTKMNMATAMSLVRGLDLH